MIELKNLCFEVFNKENKEENGKTRVIIDNLNFVFEEGKFYGITGPNGGGKTTLAKLIMGINHVSSGQIIFNGQDITKLSISERAKMGIAYGFQHSARFKGITFRDLLAISAQTDDEWTLSQIIARVGICSLDFLDKPVDSKLSGGEIKKIELATVIARNPKLAIYDEPDTGIDLWTIGPMVELLKKEKQHYKTTTIVVSHNKSFLEACDVLILIKDGKIAYTGDLAGALPMLTDLSFCDFGNTCQGAYDVRCYR